MYNKTQLNPDAAFERHVFHRDMFAHYLRWTYVLRLAKIGMRILDVGCGSGNLYEVFYRNRYSPENFTGVDIRKKTIEQNRLKFPKALWYDLDIVNDQLPQGSWDIITSFEVMEHVGKNNGQKFIENIIKVMNKETTLLISTPCYDSKVGAADNHTYDSGNGVEPQEYTYDELKELLNEYFIVEKVFGTFASVKDYKPFLTEPQKEIYDKLSEYYDSNLVSNIFAPLFPTKSRNCIWTLKLK